MKHMRRGLVLLLALVLLTGCSAGPALQSPAPAGTTAPAETTLPAETTPPAETTQPAETTRPPETTAATEPPPPQPVMKQVELTEERRYEINIFLSNFSEQGFASIGFFRSADADIECILDFVWGNVRFNTDQCKTVEKCGEYYYGIALDALSKRAQRFFGRSISASDVEHTEMGYRLIDGMVCLPPADGETYMDMTVADVLYDLGDGTMRVDFTVYEPTDKAYYDDVASAGGTNAKFIYYYTPEEAVGSGYFMPWCSGTAIVKPKTLDNGRESYELVTYEIIERLN